MVATLFRWTVKVFEIVLVACLAVMAVLVFGNVVLRYAFDSGITLSEELSRLLFVWMIFIGAVLASMQHAHIGFDTLVRSLPPAWMKAAIVFNGLLLAGASVMFIIGGWHQTRINLGNSYPVLGVSYAWLYGVAIVFGVAMLVTIAYNLWGALTGKRTSAELVLTENLGERIEEQMHQVAGRDEHKP